MTTAESWSQQHRIRHICASCTYSLCLQASGQTFCSTKTGGVWWSCPASLSTHTHTHRRNDNPGSITHKTKHFIQVSKCVDLQPLALLWPSHISVCLFVCVRLEHTGCGNGFLSPLKSIRNPVVLKTIKTHLPSILLIFCSLR